MNLTLTVVTNCIYSKEEIPFITAFNRYSTQLFYISTISDLESINMTDKNSYELMVNIMNDYFIYSELASSMVYNNIKNLIQKPTVVKNIIILISFVAIILSNYKMLIGFIHEREKPINLFLTIKKNYLKI